METLMGFLQGIARLILVLTVPAVVAWVLWRMSTQKPPFGLSGDGEKLPPETVNDDDPLQRRKTLKSGAMANVEVGGKTRSVSIGTIVGLAAIVAGAAGFAGGAANVEFVYGQALHAIARARKDAVDAIREQLPTPIGSIVAWHPVDGTPALPIGWVRCDGATTLEDHPELEGKTVIPLSKVPNLNNVDELGFLGGKGGGAFLRGGTTSGVPQGATKIPIFSEISVDDVPYMGRSKDHGAPHSDADELITDVGEGRVKFKVDLQPSPDDRVRAVRVRSVNMSVIWIIRVK
jgi:hypothetical protein